MTSDEIIWQNEVLEMARQAGFETMLRKGKILGFDRDGDYTEEIKAFAKLVEERTAAKEREFWMEQGKVDVEEAIRDEREACAKTVDDFFHAWCKESAEYDETPTPYEYSEAIRARAQADRGEA